jgi:hypothetical protein
LRDCVRYLFSDRQRHAATVNKTIAPRQNHKVGRAVLCTPSRDVPRLALECEPYLKRLQYLNAIQDFAQ